jgi:hypothetical protein
MWVVVQRQPSHSWTAAVLTGFDIGIVTYVPSSQSEVRSHSTVRPEKGSSGVCEYAGAPAYWSDGMRIGESPAT